MISKVTILKMAHSRPLSRGTLGKVTMGLYGSNALEEQAS